MGLVVVLRASRVLGVESCDEDSEDDSREDEEDGVRSCFLRLRLRDGSLEALCLLRVVEVDGLDKVGLLALVRAALTADSSAAC